MRKHLLTLSFIWIISFPGFSNFAGDELLGLYKIPVPMTFGLLFDLHLKIFSLKYTDALHETRMYIGKSGGVQLHIRFQRDHLPLKKGSAEQFIEDKALKIKREADLLVQGLWNLFPKDIPETAFADQMDIVHSFVFLNGVRIGFADGDTFYWKKKQIPERVMTNKW